MKSTLNVLALAVFSTGCVYAQNTPTDAPSPVILSEVSVRGGISWSLKNVYRGKERSDGEGLFAAQVTLESSIPNKAGYSVYASAYSADAFERTYNFGVRNDSSLGNFDLGYQHSTAHSGAARLATDGFTQIPTNGEAYLGYISTKDVVLRPSLYVFYSFDLQETNVVLSGRKDFAGAEIGLPGFDLTTKFYAGADHASTTVFDRANSYYYLGASADITRPVGTNGLIGLGVNWAYNTDKLPQTEGSTFWYKVYTAFRF